LPALLAICVRSSEVKVNNSFVIREVENHTFTWDVDLTFNVVWLFDFEEIPQTARQYIMLKAARKFQGQELGSDNLGRYTEKNEQDAEAIFKDAEGTDAGHNILTGNYSVYRTLDRRVD
jgi:hypothetical protein